MRHELRPLVRPLALRRTGARDPELYTGAIGRVEIVAAITGIGVRAAARATERVLDTGGVDQVVVVGIAGGIGPSVEIGDLVVPERVVDLASTSEHRARPLGDAAPRGTLVTADGLIVDPEVFARLEQAGGVGIAMGGGAGGGG